MMIADIRKSHRPVFVSWGHHYKQFSPRHVGKLCSSVAQQQFYSSAGWYARSFRSQCPWLFQCEFPRSMDWKRRTSRVASPFSWSYAFWLLPFGLCESLGVEPKSEYPGRTQKTDHWNNCKGYIAVWRGVDYRWGCMQSYRRISLSSVSHPTTLPLVCKNCFNWLINYCKQHLHVCFRSQIAGAWNTNISFGRPCIYSYVYIHTHLQIAFKIIFFPSCYTCCSKQEHSTSWFIVMIISDSQGTC
jgi:hypothetical protein